LSTDYGVCGLLLKLVDSGGKAGNIITNYELRIEELTKEKFWSQVTPLTTLHPPFDSNFSAIGGQAAKGGQVAEGERVFNPLNIPLVIAQSRNISCYIIVIIISGSV